MILSRNILFSLCFVAALGIQGCKQVRIVNGELPVEYQKLAQKYMNTYRGSFESNLGSLKLELVGKKVLVSFSGQTNDITGDEACQSQLGDLQSIQVDDQVTQLQAASFSFSANHCPEIQGGSLDLIFTQNGQKLKVSAAILKRITQLQICQVAATMPSHPTPTPSPPPQLPTCHIDFQYFYLNGVFLGAPSIDSSQI